MALLKFKNNSKWETLYLGAFTRMIQNMKNIHKSLNNMKTHVVARLRRNKNLSDLDNPDTARRNIGLIGDCSTLARAPHNHDKEVNKWLDDARRATMPRLQSLISTANSLSSCHSGCQEELNNKADAAWGGHI